MLKWLQGRIMESNYTNLQTWKVIRALVKDNNAFMRKIYSSSVRGYINGYIQRNGFSPKHAELEKSKIITSGMKDIYNAVSARFLEQDRDAVQKYFDLKAQNKDWLDYLSVKDLFVLFTFQNKAIAQMRKEHTLDVGGMIQIINRTPVMRSYNGSVQFTGKPKSREEDRQGGFDITNQETRVEVIANLAKTFCGESRSALTHVSLGRHGTEVIKRYFDSKEQGAAKYEQRTYNQSRYQRNEPAHKKDMEPAEEEGHEYEYDTKRWLGIDVNGAPVYSITDRSGNTTYINSLGETHSGFIYEETDRGYVPVFNTEEDEAPEIDPDVEERENVLNFRRLESDNQLHFIEDKV